MKLLSKKTIKDDQDSRLIELNRVISSLKDEESRIIKTVNDLKLNLKKEREKVQVSLIQRKEESEKVKIEIRNEINILDQEVLLLEERKQKALEPINAIKTEANARLKKAEEKEDYVEKRYLAVNEFEKRLAERVEDIGKTEKDNMEKTREADQRMEKSQERERVIKEKEVNFDKEVGEHYRLSTEIESFLKRKERELVAKEMAIKELDKRAKEEFSKVAEGRLRLQSDYNALEQAKKHLNIK